MTSVFSAPFTSCAAADQLPSLAEVPLIEWTEFHRQRNAVLEALRPLGSVGPLGAYPLGLDPEAADVAWSIEAADPTFYVLDDLMGPLVTVEVRSSAELRPPVFEALWKVTHIPELVRVSVTVAKQRYFYLDGRGVWFLDQAGERAASLDEAIGLPIVGGSAA